MLGAQMVMQALGIDPEEIEAVKRAIPEFAQKIDTKVTAMEAHLKEIAADQKTLLSGMDIIMAHITKDESKLLEEHVDPTS